MHLRDDKFLINCSARTGSTLLVHLLNSHPDAICHGEPFGPEVVGNIAGRYRAARQADPEAERVVQQMRDEYSTRWTSTTRPFPDIPELVIELHARQVRTTVLSNKPDGPTREIVGELFPDKPFEIVHGARERVPLKPDPTSTLEIISGAKVSPKQTVFVGDTPVDIETGANAGTRTVGVTWGFRDAQELLEAGADHIIHQPFELLHLLNGTAREAGRS